MTQLALRFTYRNGRAILAERRVLYPYAITAPINRAGAAELTLQSISGGIYGGETLSQNVEVSEGARAKLIQPAATTVRRKTAGPARQTIMLEAGKNASLTYFTRPLIMLPGSALAQNWNILLAPGAQILLFDGFLSHAEGADWHFSSRLTARATSGHLLATERMEVHKADLEHFTAYGKFWCFGQPLPSSLPAQPEIETGITTLANNAGFTIALAAKTGGALCAAMEKFEKILSQPGKFSRP
ncbi:MAG: urease accessory protein UreD [Rhodospirillales bacterium]|nr:urease accessory protein UreD [Rhodospirillales bacterium]